MSILSESNMNEWTREAISDPANWTQYPPVDLSIRKKVWERNYNIQHGRHEEVFGPSKIQVVGSGFTSEEEMIFDVMRMLYEDRPDQYLVCNYCGLLTRTFASLLFGEPVTFAPENKEDATVHALNKIADNNGLSRMNIAQARTVSAQGYTFYRVRWGKKASWLEEGVVIEAIPGYNVTPLISLDNIKDCGGYVIAFKLRHNGRDYLRQEWQLPGKVLNKLFEMDGGAIGSQVPLDTVPEFSGLQEEIDTGYPGLLMFYVPNEEVIDEFWGGSDYAEIESLQQAINIRASDIDRVISKHAGPKLILPPGLMHQDDKGNWRIRKEDLEAIEINDPEMGKVLPRYVTWDAQLAAAFQELDKMVEIAMTIAQVSPPLYTTERQYAGESGSALKLRLVQSLARVNDKRMAFESALSDMMYAGLVLMANHGLPVDPSAVFVEWSYGLPEDEETQAKIYATLSQSRLVSRRMAVKKIHKLNGNALEEEVAEIAAEQQSGMEY